MCTLSSPSNKWNTLLCTFFPQRVNLQDGSQGRRAVPAAVLKGLQQGAGSRRGTCGSTALCASRSPKTLVGAARIQCSNPLATRRREKKVSFFHQHKLHASASPPLQTRVNHGFRTKSSCKKWKFAH